MSAAPVTRRMLEEADEFSTLAGTLERARFAHPGYCLQPGRGPIPADEQKIVDTDCHLHNYSPIFSLISSNAGRDRQMTTQQIKTVNGSAEIGTYTIPGEKNFLKKELTVFIILSMLVSWPLILIVVGRMSPDFQIGNAEAAKDLFESIPLLYGFGPFISAIVVTLIYRKKSGVKELFKKVIEWRVSIKWYVWALMLPVMPQWIGLLLWGQLTTTGIALPPLTSFLSSWLQIALISAVYYITEELGWRGFMLPRLLSMDEWIKSSLILGVIWSIWHYPLWFASNWATSGSLQVAVLMVAASTVFTIAVSVMVGWIFKNTKGSILLSMLFHGSSQANLTNMYAAAGNLSLSGPGFILVEAVTLSLAALLLILVGERNRNLPQTRESTYQDF